MACTALAPVPAESLPPTASDPDARATQLIERSFWLGRDLRQTANNRDICQKQSELVALIERNNAGVED